MRSILFYIISVIASIVICTFGLPLLMTMRGAKKVARTWAGCMLILCKYILRIDYTTNINMSDSGHLIACNHQSVLEILILLRHVPNCVFILKRELIFIPLINLYLLRSGQIAINRKSPDKNKLFEQASRAIKHSNIIIFPQGTRVEYGSIGTYKPGVALLAKKLQVKISLCITDAGRFWGRRSLGKTRGVCKVVQLSQQIGFTAPLREIMHDIEQNLSQGLNIKQEQA